MIQSQLKTGEKKVATFAGGCFWCLQGPFEAQEGVSNVKVGYTGGQRANPSYEQVSTGVSGHREAMQLEYDPDKVSYQDLLRIFWLQIDPTDAGGQFADRGHQYTTAIYVHDEEQRRLAEESKASLAAEKLYDKPIVTVIEPAQPFYEAEEYHQEYYKKFPDRYIGYAMLSGRKDFVVENTSKWKNRSKRE